MTRRQGDLLRPLTEEERTALGSCIFKADFKILFRNFTGYLRY